MNKTVLVILFFVSFCAQAMHYAEDDVKVALLASNNHQKTITPSVFLTLPSELITSVALSLESSQEAVALHSTCKQLLNDHSLSLLLKFIQRLTTLQKIIEAKLPFFNDDLVCDLSKKWMKVVTTKAQLDKILDSITIYCHDRQVEAGSLPLYGIITTQYRRLSTDLGGGTPP